MPAADVALVLVPAYLPHGWLPRAPVCTGGWLGTCYDVLMLVCSIVTLPPGSLGVFDPTEIRNRGMLSKLQTEAFLKIGYHLVVFFISLYW